MAHYYQAERFVIEIVKKAQSSVFTKKTEEAKEESDIVNADSAFQLYSKLQSCTFMGSELDLSYQK